MPSEGRLHLGDTRVLHGPRSLWCAESIELLWEKRGQMISEEERPAAEAAYQRAAALYRQRAEEADED